MQAKLQFLDHQIVTSCIAMVNVVFLLFIWKEMAWKILNLENLEFYTCTLWDHNAKYLIMTYKRDSWVPNDCILAGMDETKWTTFDFMRNDVLQNYLDQFLIYLAENFDNLKFQDTSKVVIFIAPNSYILHCHGKCGLFTIYLKRKLHEKFWIWKILNFIHVHCRTTMQNFELWLIGGTHGCQMTAFWQE